MEDVFCKIETFYTIFHFKKKMFLTKSLEWDNKEIKPTFINKYGLTNNGKSNFLFLLQHDEKVSSELDYILNGGGKGISVSDRKGLQLAVITRSIHIKPL